MYVEHVYFIQNRRGRLDFDWVSPNSYSPPSFQIKIFQWNVIYQKLVSIYITFNVLILRKRCAQGRYRFGGPARPRKGNCEPGSLPPNCGSHTNRLSSDFNSMICLFPGKQKAVNAFRNECFGVDLRWLPCAGKLETASNRPGLLRRGRLRVGSTIRPAQLRANIRGMYFSCVKLIFNA